MTTAVRLCTDSSAQLPTSLAAALGVTVVPVGITIDGEPFEEGVDLDSDAFYARLSQGATVSTSQPSPGRFADAYAAARTDGAREIVSIHLDGRVSGTANAATLAAREARLPVTVVDTGTVSFGVAVCLLAADRALGGGVPPGELAAHIDRLVPQIGNVFVASRAPGARVPARDDLTLFSFLNGAALPLEAALDFDQAAQMMSQHIDNAGGLLRCAVGHADEATKAAADLLATKLAQSGRVSELIRYRVGPSVGAHTGPLSFGAFWWPADVG